MYRLVTISACALVLTLIAGCKKSGEETVHGSADFIASDSIELFFKSKGVIVFDASGDHVSKNIEILNEDSSRFATLDLGHDALEIGGKKFSLEALSTDDALKQELHFLPKEFYPDYYVLQFEFTKLEHGVAEIFLDKEQNIRKLVRVDNVVLKAESWRHHLLTAMIDFDRNQNLVRREKSDQAPSVGYEKSESDFVFVGEEVSGQWMKIKCAEICDLTCEAATRYEGWIRWTDGKKLLVRLLYVC